MIAVITNTISCNLEEKEYRLYIFVKTNQRTTNKYKYVRIKTKGKKLYFKIGVKDETLIEELCYSIAKVFAEYKEPIHIYIKDKCIVR